MSIELETYLAYSSRSALGPYRAEDYWKLPEESRYELIYGRFCLSPSPSILHQVVVQFLAEYLWRTVRPSGGFVVLAPMDAILAEHSIVQPDVLYIGPARRSIVKEKVEGTPDLVVEVISPGTGRQDRGEKLRLYAEAGVKEYWIVDPVERTFEILVNREGTFEVAVPLDDRYQSAALPEIQVNLLEFWNEVDARLP